MCQGGTSTKIEPEIPSAAQPLWDRLMKGMDAMGQSYGGGFTAPLSGDEEMGMKLLRDYATGSSGNTDLANSLLADTMGGKYLNPQSNPYLAKMANNIVSQTKLNLGGQANQLGSMFQKSGMGMGSGERTYTNKLLSDTNAGLGNALANLYGTNYQTERSRQMQAVPMLSQLSQEPLTRANALMQVGGLERGIQQQGLNMTYQDWLRILNSPYQYGMNLMNSMPLQYPQYSYQPGTMEQLMGALPGLASGAGSMMMELGPMGLGTDWSKLFRTSQPATA